MASQIDDVRMREERGGIPGAGLIKGLTVTLKHMLRPAVTQQYPKVKPDLPPRTRGVIALKEANCTVCYKCSRECPDWCIYIDAHKESHDPAGGGKARSVKVLDRFAIDYSLCMYCGICVEVCPFDALFWSPEYEYAEYEIDELIHEKERLEEWTTKVLPPPLLEVGAEPLIEEEVVVDGGGSGGSLPGDAAGGTAPAAAGPSSPSGVPSPGDAAAGQVATGPAAETPAPATAAPAPPGAPHVEVEPDQETHDRVLAEELAKGTDARVAEGKAKRAAMIAARKKAGA